jgi:ankyrin repeat protein
MGFRAENALRQHIDECHKDQALSENIRPSIRNIEPDQLEALLTDAVTACEVEYVRRFLPRTSDEIPEKLYLEAVTKSTAAVVELFINSGKDINKIVKHTRLGSINPVPLIEAVGAKNVEVAKFLLDHGCDMYEQSYYEGGRRPWRALDRAMAIPEIDVSMEMIKLLVHHGIDLTKRTSSLESLIPPYSGQESQVIKRLEIFKFALKKGDNFNHALKAVAQKNCSINIAEFLLLNGADVNRRGSFANALTRHTPLYIAANRTTLEAAQLAKFLLESGADPSAKVRGRTAGELPGAQNISKWLGMTWDELVELTAAARAVTTKP